MYRESYALDQQRFLPDVMEERLTAWFARCIGIALCVVGAAGWISLLTWSVGDPSLSHASYAPASNLLGAPGAVVSDLLLQFFGLASVFIVLAPAVWGYELIAGGQISMFRLRVLLLPVATLALAAGTSALPTAATWPLYHGFGGLLGDLIYNLAASILTLALPARSAGLAGLVLFSGGLAAFTCCLGLAGREPLARWQSAATYRPQLGGLFRRRAVSPVNPGIEPALQQPVMSPEPRPERVREAAPAPMTIDRAQPVADETWAPEHESDTADEELDGGRDVSFDADTDLASREIAKRFAPNNAAVRPGSEPTLELPLDLPSVAPKPAPRPANRGLRLRRKETGFRQPSLNLLKRPTAVKQNSELVQSMLNGTARLLEDVLADFGVKGEIKDIKPGPVVTLFELEPARGTKSARVIGLAEDIARSMSAMAVRVAVVPGRNVIGIELPNTPREGVLLREIFEAGAFKSTGATLPLALGKSIGGDPIVVDLARMPHLLVAGTTGSGKSVGINAMVLSLLYKLSPDDCRLIMIDPKMLELSVYDNIPHLLTPVVTDPHKAVAALNWAVREMEERYKRMARLGVRNIDVFNNRVRHAKMQGGSLQRTVQTGFDRKTGEAIFETETFELEPMPYIVIVVDEFADLMMVAGKEIEAAVQRLAQMARAAGIHLIMATQRPSVDVITGTIKANFPTRISFKVTSKVDSRTILNEQGAEQLLGQGDMLFSPGSGQVVRVHGPFVSDEEVDSIAQFLRQQGEPNYVDGVTDVEVDPEDLGGHGGAGASGKGADADLYDKAVAIVLRDRKASTSYLQRRLSIGYNRAASLMERMEDERIVGPANATGKRDILMTRMPEEDDTE